ncbi:transglycosylase SLT domain-containing protein [Candidatus Margulisiibacteriota bacterium]
MSQRILRLVYVLIFVLVLIIVADHFSLGDQYKRAKLLFKQEKYVQAIPLFKTVLRRDRYIGDYAQYYLAETYFQLKEYNLADQGFKDLLAVYPKNHFIEKAEYRLVQIALQKKQKLSVEQEYIQAIGMYNDREYGPASVHFANIIRYYPRFKKRGEAYHYLGLCQFFLRKYKSASESFNYAIRYGNKYYVKTLWWSARAYRRIRWYRSALVRYGLIYKNYPRHDLAPEAFVAAAEVYTDLKQYKNANYLFSLLRKRYSNHLLAGESYWKEAWNYYRRKRYDQAHHLFAAGVEQLPNNGYSAALCFWAGKSAEKLGQADLAKKYYAKAVQDYDHNYYAYLSARKARLKMPKIPKDKVILFKGRNPWSKRYQFLLRQKAYDDAWLEVSSAMVTADIQVKARTYLELSQAALDVGELLPHLGFLEKYLRLRYVPRAELPLGFWLNYYPRPYIRLIKNMSAKYYADKDLICGLIREESKFDSDAISNVGARGLMQLMPKTAQGMLKNRQIDPARLYDPKLNINLGVRYFSGLLKRFKQNQVFALAAYNAGPHRVVRWQRDMSAQDIDEWIENIPFGETRNYVKRVLRSYWEYQRLY